MAWNDGRVELENVGTYFGFVLEGTAELTCAQGSFSLRPGMYFSVPGEIRIEGEGRGFAVCRNRYRGFFSIGGPVEEKGRLNYIDGCTDSLLIPPVKWGDPCLNLLHIPPETEQSRHTHPSIRVGVIVSGSGECVTPEKRYSLNPGVLFVIPAEAEHSFYTKDEALRVIAWHPDSDFGPTDEVHPMVNRTILPGGMTS